MNYTEEQIKKAFWDTFHRSGEWWFPHRDEDERGDNEETQGNYDIFKEQLEKYK